MGWFDKYGLAYSPRSLSTVISKGWLNAWTYDNQDINNILRDQSLHLRNNADQMLGYYTSGLKEQLSLLRKKLPTPTRENPFPPQEMLNDIRDFEDYMRKIEAIRVRIINAPIPPREIVFTSSQENVNLLKQLRGLDEHLVDLLNSIDEVSVNDVIKTLEERESIVRNFAVKR